MSEWISVKKIAKPKESGMYLILVNRNISVAFYKPPQWDRGWQIPDEWNDPSHWMELPPCPPIQSD